jgi:hypothetical protein
MGVWESTTESQQWHKESRSETAAATERQGKCQQALETDHITGDNKASSQVLTQD